MVSKRKSRINQTYEYSVPVHIFTFGLDTIEWLEVNCAGAWGFKYFDTGAKYVNVSFALTKDMIMFLKKVNL